MRRLVLSILLLLTISFSAGAQFLDVSADSPFHKPINYLIDNGILTVGKTHLFKPYVTINKYEMSVLVMRSLQKIFTDRKVPLSTAKSMKRYFKDLSPKNYAYDSISRLYKIGIISRPENNKFNGSRRVTRYEFYTAFSKMLGFLSIKGKQLDQAEEIKMYQDVSKKHWSYTYIEALVRMGLLPEAENALDAFGGNKKVTRQEAAIFIYIVMKNFEPAVSASK